MRQIRRALDSNPVLGYIFGVMEQLTQFIVNYWPHLLGLSFVVLIALNFRSWRAGQKSEG